jgi:MEMO1 family protein
LPILRPRLRPIETVVVPDERFGQAIMLRDGEGVTPKIATVPAPLVPILARFTGAHTVGEIAALCSRDLGSEVPSALVQKLADELDHALFLDSPRYQAARLRIEQEFARAPVREATHAGGAYHADPAKLQQFLDRECIGNAGPKEKNGAVRGLIAPHIDPWRGKRGYGHAYGLLRAGLSEHIDTFVLLGTSHAPMRESFALCSKAFDTPFGAIEVDRGAVDAIASRAPFDPFTDVFNHKREHSLEFQAVFVKHLVGDRPVRIIPILCGIGDSQRTGRSPEEDPHADTFLRAVHSIVQARSARTVVIAGADLAHVGPRFGDPAPYDADDRHELERTDRTSLEMAAAREHREFFFQVQRDLETRRVCGLGPIYALLRVLPEGCTGRLAHYEQTIDPQEGSIVSHAAMAFFG